MKRIYPRPFLLLTVECIENVVKGLKTRIKENCVCVYIATAFLLCEQQ